MTIYISRTGVGTANSDTNINRVIYDSTGTGMLPVQAKVTGAATFRLLARVDPSAPWVEFIPAGTADFLQSIAWVPFVQLEITAGAGTVDLWIGEK